MITRGTLRKNSTYTAASFETSQLLDSRATPMTTPATVAKMTPATATKTVLTAATKIE